MVAIIASGHSPRQQENWSAEEGGSLCGWLLMHSKQSPTRLHRVSKKEHLPNSVYPPSCCCAGPSRAWHSKTF